MGDIFLRESLDYLLEAQSYGEMFIPIDDYEDIFESDDPEVQKKIKNNETVVTGANNGFKKAGQAIYNFILSIIQKFKSLFNGNKKKDLDGARAAFNQAVSKKPSLKNKTMSAQDWNAINKDYSDLLSKIDDCEKQLELNPSFDISAVLKSVDDFTGNISSRAWSAYKMDLALNLASTSQEVARKAYADLKNNAEAEKKLIDSVGLANTKKFENDLKRLGSKHQLLRARAKAGDAVCKNALEAVNKSTQTVKEMANGVLNTVADGLIGAKTGEGFVAGAVGSDNLKRNLSNIADSKDKKRMLKNMGVVSGAMKTSKNIKNVKTLFTGTKKDIKKRENEQKMIAKHQAKGDYSDQSMAQAFLGQKVGKYAGVASKIVSGARSAAANAQSND